MEAIKRNGGRGKTSFKAENSRYLKILSYWISTVLKNLENHVETINLLFKKSLYKFD
jgi:hypothetical protein